MVQRISSYDLETFLKVDNSVYEENISQRGFFFKERKKYVKEGKKTTTHIGLIFIFRIEKEQRTENNRIGFIKRYPFYF